MIDRAPGLITDLYELTMAAAYFENGLHHRAIFELFTRRLSKHRAYLIVAGLEQALDYLSSLRFSDAHIDYLREHPSFKKVSREFFQYLADSDLRAMCGQCPRAPRRSGWSRCCELLLQSSKPRS